MLVDLKKYFCAVHTHHRLSPDARDLDLTCRLTQMADPRFGHALRVDDLTRRCLRWFLDRRLA